MSGYTERQIAEIVSRVVQKLASDGGSAPAPAASAGPTVFVPRSQSGDGIYSDPDAAIKAKQKWYEEAVPPAPLFCQ